MSWYCYKAKDEDEAKVIIDALLRESWVDEDNVRNLLRRGSSGYIYIHFNSYNIKKARKAGYHTGKGIVELNNSTVGWTPISAEEIKEKTEFDLPSVLVGNASTITTAGIFFLLGR